MNFELFEKSSFSGDAIKTLVKKAEAMRRHSDTPVDMSFAEVLAMEHDGMTVDSFYEQIGVDVGFDTIQNLFTSPADAPRWLVPEIFRDSLRLGYRNAPLWPAITSQEQQVTGLSQVLPYLNMSDAAPKKVGEGETFPVGTLSYGDRSFKIHKFGRGIKIPDEVQRYVALAVVSIYLEDFGLKMGQGVDTLALDTLINGEQAAAANASPVIGIKTPGTMVFRDLLKLWVRLVRVGRNPKLMICGEDTTMDLLGMTEFKARTQGTTQYNLNVKTPLPQGSGLYINGNLTDTHIVVVDPSVALIKMNAVPLVVESERIVSNQTQAWYASFTTGFAKLFDDSAFIIDTAKNYASYGMPDILDVDPSTLVNMD